MTDYKKYINALRKCAKEHENDRTFTGNIIVSDLCRDTANLLEDLEQEPKTGHWREDIDNNRKWDRVRFYCSECGKWQTYGKTHYCPHCGAKMEEKKE